MYGYCCYKLVAITNLLSFEGKTDGLLRCPPRVDRTPHLCVQAPTATSTLGEAGPADPCPPLQATPCADAEPAREPDPKATSAPPPASDKDRKGSAADAPAKPTTTSIAASLPSEARGASGGSAPPAAGAFGAQPGEEKGGQAGVQGNAGEGDTTSAWAPTERGSTGGPVMAPAYLQDYAVIEDRAQSMGLYGVQPQNSWEDATLLFLASTLTVLIIAIVFRRLLLITGTDLTALL